MTITSFRRIRTTTMVAATTLFTAFTVGLGVTPAHAAPTCYGHPVTVMGSPGPDSLNGTPNADVIYGDAGNDTIYGFGGDDVICGAGGNDVIYGGDHNDLLFGGEFFNGNSDGIDRLFGGNGNDSLHGGDASDLLNGENDEDVLYGNLGDDVLYGGPGVNDIASFQYDKQGVVADLAAGTATGQGSDTLSDIERLVGSPSHDRLYGDAGRNVLLGLDGDDLLDGRGDIDTVKYNNGLSPHPINANLTTGVAVGIGHGTDRLVSIENLGGTFYDDQLTGNDGPNLLAGRVGSDTLVGMGGDDVLMGGGDNKQGAAENDVLVGGDGNDTLHGQEGADVLDGGPGTDPGDGGGPGTNFCFNIEVACQ